MTRGEKIEIEQPVCTVDQESEFHFLVAFDAGIRRATGLVFGLEIVENVFLVLFGQRDYLVIDSETLGDTFRFDEFA